MNLRMARAPFLLPNVFVGCPYGHPFQFTDFKKTLDRLPFAWNYANTQLKTKHLLSILTTYIKSVDFCLFDLSFWNANVSLELGLAEGLGVDYYILVNARQSKDVPSDLKGLQRIEYNSVTGTEANDLLPNLVTYLVRDQTHPRHIWNRLSSPNRDKKFYFALAVLAHFRDNKRLSYEDRSRLSKGLWLRKEVQEEIIGLLDDLHLLSATGSRLGAKLSKRLYPPPLKLS
jgi:hypothetical protein